MMSVATGCEESFNTVKDPAVDTVMIEPVEVVMDSVIAVPVCEPEELKFVEVVPPLPHECVLALVADDAMLHLKSTFLTVPLGTIKPLVRVNVESLVVPDAGLLGFTTSEPEFS